MKQKVFERNKAFRFRRFARKAYAAFNSMHKTVSIGVLTGCMFSFVHATEIAAQNYPVKTGDDVGDQELEEVTVSASRVETTLNQAAKLVTVITRKEIEQSPAQSIQDLLKMTVGVDVRQRGANGVQSDISVRGGTFDQVAILLNGVNLSNPQTGHYSFDIPVNLSDIERIEIIQGPSSLLYGASAFAGGINIITKKHSDQDIYAGLETGMHSLFGATAGGSFKSKQYEHQLSAGYNSSNGYINNSDYNIFNSLWQSHFNIHQSTLDFQAGYNQKQYGANTFYSAAYPNQYDKTKSVFAAVKGEVKESEKLKLIPQLYWNRHYDCYQLFRDGSENVPTWYIGHNYHISDVYGANINAQYTSKFGITSFGGEFRNEGVLSNVLGKPMSQPDGKYTKSDNRSNISSFIEQNVLLDRLTLTLGVLANYNTFLNDGLKFYPSASISYSLTNHVRIYSLYSQAMRMPTFTDLYYTTKTHIGNSDLKAEESESFEFGVKYNSKLMTSYITGFYMKGKNIIDWVKESPDDLWESRNLTELNKAGMETAVSFHLKELVSSFPSSTSLTLGYMYMNQTKDAGNLISNYALDYLKHKFTTSLSHPVWMGITANWQYRWQDREGSYTRYENLKPAYEVAYPAYGILDLRLNRTFKKAEVHLDINNLFNKEYYDLGNVPQPGFWLMGGVKYNINL